MSITPFRIGYHTQFHNTLSISHRLCTGGVQSDPSPYVELHIGDVTFFRLTPVQLGKLADTCENAAAELDGALGEYKRKLDPSKAPDTLRPEEI